VGETQNRPFQLSFNSSLKVDFQGARVTSDGGLILVRELDERLGLSALMERHLTDSRRGKNTQLSLADLLRQSISAWRVTKMSTTPSGSLRIRLSGSSAPGRSGNAGQR
jgi:hypothetical protein